VEGVTSKFILALIISAQFGTAQQTGVRWFTIDPFCGRIVSGRPQSFPITRASVKLYRATEKHKPCCASASRSTGFRSTKREISTYERWHPDSLDDCQLDSVEVPVALWFDAKHDLACDQQYRNIIKVEPSTKAADVSLVASTNAINNAQTH